MILRGRSRQDRSLPGAARFFYFLYTLVYCLVLVCLLPFEYLKRPKEVRRRWRRERFALYDSPGTGAAESPCVWIHAVSVGETLAAVPLIRKIRHSFPDAEIVVSTVTDTGQKIARERVGDTAEVVYAPFDVPFCIRAAVARIRPSLFLILETELWPNAVRVVSGLGVPVVLVNGRISDKSFHGYRRVRFFLKEMLGGVRLFCMQSEIYAERIRELGAPPGRVLSIGSFKFDTKPSSPPPPWTKALQGPVVIAGSTHATEEELVLDAYERVRGDFPGLNLIIAPRHPERFREVEEVVRKRGFVPVKRSEMASGRENTGEGPAAPSFPLSGRVILLDVMGELSSVYGAADIAVMGGSFIGHGGQNPLEPAWWGKAILCGPHMENFPFVEEFYRNGGALRIAASSLSSALRELLGSPEKRGAMGGKAQELYRTNAGAVDRAFTLLEKYLSAKV
ncbi:MAG: 3-deoxy-D-manno-octulosonic acid transferase [Alphaproteobacteria bacterium]|uniref:3-deoxy-D-manno-octulosonic acid transferase n=1 Tax=Candidatus Nitrobium versatile TaxID=2884831 RepID=A0A953J6M3_9BACT|nr:3-deoxy-D-manno-octulosonic acid transferase [Candidatus Nitrobium versatile]